MGRIECRNLLATDEACVEWHATYRDRDGDEWQLDMIHIVRDSRYDGYFERVADRIATALTPVTRRAILQLKYDTPDDVKIAGIEYYVAVLPRRRAHLRRLRRVAAYHTRHYGHRRVDP